jgi:predicted kinase
VGSLLAEGVSVVVDGEFLMPEERADLVDALPPGVEPRFITLSVTYEEALKRARSDETRGVSRDPAFLSAHYEATARAVREAPSADLLLDTV